MLTQLGGKLVFVNEPELEQDRAEKPGALGLLVERTAQLTLADQPRCNEALPEAGRYVVLAQHRHGRLGCHLCDVAQPGFS